MFEELNERRKAVERNIAKGFGMDDADLDFEKALEDEFEKGRAKKQFNIGDTFTRHGITYKCTGISANTGRPTWSKVKDGEGSKQEQPEKKGDNKEEQIPFDVDLEVADEMWTGKESKAYDKALESGDEKEQKRLLKIAIDRAKEKGVNIARKKDSDSMNGVTRHMSQGQEEEAVKQAIQEKKTDDNERQDCAVEWLEFDKNDRLKKKRKEFDSQDKARAFIDKIAEKDNFYQVTATSGLQEQEEKQKPKKLSELKRGDTVALIMERYNPQLGNYVTIKKVQIEGTTSKSFKVDYMKFDKETGERSDKSSSVYGSSKHYILLPEEVNTHIKDGKWKGDRISGGNPFEDE